MRHATKEITTVTTSETSEGGGAIADMPNCSIYANSYKVKRIDDEFGSRLILMLLGETDQIVGFMHPKAVLVQDHY